MSGENARHGLKAAFWTESFELKDHQSIPWNENKNFIVYIDDIINESFFFFIWEVSRQTAYRKVVSFLSLSFGPFEVSLACDWLT